MDEEHTQVEPWLQALGLRRKTQFAVYITNKKFCKNSRLCSEIQACRDFTIKRWGSLRILGSACKLSQNVSRQHHQSLL